MLPAWRFAGVGVIDGRFPLITLRGAKRMDAERCIYPVSAMLSENIG